MEQFGSYWTDLDEISHLSFFQKSVEVSLKSDKNEEYFT
jgi:hypothetical protein